MLSPDQTHLSLAFLNLPEIPLSLAQKYGTLVKHLDLTGNKLCEYASSKRILQIKILTHNSGDLSGLGHFTRLETVVLDDNGLTGIMRLPPSLPCLKTLCVNKNNIENLSGFLDRVVKVRSLANCLHL
jgi:Leucine-rich repeat (LRR) protein